jgi:hypothetical protein
VLERSPRVTDDLLRRLGERSAPFLEADAKWVHRRIESVSWIDEKIWRRRVSVDFTIPHGMPGVRRRGGRNLFYMPVASLQKWPPLLGLDLEAGGLSTHLLTSAGNGLIDHAVMRRLAARAMGVLLLHRVEEPIRTLATSSDIAEGSAAFDALRKAMPGHVDPLASRRLLALAATMIRANILWFPVLGHPGERHVVKFSYDEVAQVKRRLAVGLAWSPQTYWVELDHLGDSGSYHVDVAAPEGLQVGRDPRLFFVVQGDAPASTSDATLLDMQPVGQRLHAYVNATRPGKALLNVPVAAPRNGFISGAWIATFGIMLMLFAFWHWAEEMAKDTQSSVAILVLVPVLLGYIAVRPVVHPVAVAQVARVRDLLMISGALSLAAAVGLVRYAQLGQYDCVRILCRDLFFAELLIVVLISISWLRSRGD